MGIYTDSNGTTYNINIDDDVINFVQIYSETIIKELSSIYNFDQIDAMKRLNINLNINNNSNEDNSKKKK